MLVSEFLDLSYACRTQGNTRNTTGAVPSLKFSLSTNLLRTCENPGGRPNTETHQLLESADAMCSISKKSYYLTRKKKEM